MATRTMTIGMQMLLNDFISNGTSTFDMLAILDIIDSYEQVTRIGQRVSESGRDATFYREKQEEYRKEFRELAISLDITYEIDDLTSEDW